MENQLLLALKNNKLLKNVDISKINLDNIKGKLMPINEGEVLYRESQPASSIYLIVSGEINLVRKKLLGKTRSLILGENDFLGHDEFFDETARTSTAVALKDSYLIELSEDEVQNLIQQDTVVYENLREPLYTDIDTVPAPTKVEEPEEKINDELGAVEDSTNKLDFNIADTSTNEIDFTPTPSRTPSLNVGEEKVDKASEESQTSENVTPSPESETVEDNKNEFDFTPTPSRPPNENIEEDQIDEKDEEAPVTENVSPSPEPEIPNDDFDLDTLKALQSLEDTPDNKVNESTTEFNVISEMSDDDAAFFAGLSSVEESAPAEEDLEPQKTNESLNFDLDNIDNSDEIGKNENIELPKEDDSLIIDEPVSFNEPEEVGKPTIEEESQREKIEIPEEPEENNAPPIPIIDKAKKRKQLEDEVMTADQLEMITKAAELVNSNIKLDDVLNNIVDVATNLTSADRGTLYLVDRENNELWSKVAMGNEMKEIRLKLGEGISGWVGQSGEVVNIEDVAKDNRFKSDFDKSSGYITKNMLCFPIKNKKAEVVGVLQLLNSGNGKFSEIDQEFLNALSIHAALALENAGLVEKLLHGERVSSLGKMANFLIQDIKKPILVSKRYAEHLKTKELPPETIQVLDMMLEQLNQVADLVQTTSSYSEGKRILHTLTVNFMETMEDFAQRMASYVQTRNCEIINNVDANINMKLDVKEFYQCYMHIVRNACDAMPEGGRIIVFSLIDDNILTLSFKDNGLGIPDSIKDKIFEPFTSHGKKEGTGLGLSITKQIVEAHGGEIMVDSDLGEGATITIKLPVTA